MRILVLLLSLASLVSHAQTAPNFKGCWKGRYVNGDTTYYTIEITKSVKIGKERYAIISEDSVLKVKFNRGTETLVFSISKEGVLRMHYADHKYRMSILSFIIIPYVRCDREFLPIEK